MKQIPAPILTLVAGVIITLVSLWVGQNNHWLPEQASEQAVLIDSLFNTMLVISTALFIVVEGTIIYFTIRFRKRAGDETDGVPVEGNLPLEAFWTAIPAIIVIGLSLYSVDIFQQIGASNPGDHGSMAHSHHKPTLVAQAPTSNPMAGDVSPLLGDGQVAYDYGTGAPPDESSTSDLVVDVKGMQFAWIFNYPDSGITTGELHVPLGRSVRLNLSAADVIHSFWVPQFRLKQDAIPGQQTGLRFVASKTGTFPVVCTELCGSYHGAMRTQVIVHAPEEFNDWLSKNRVARSPAQDTVAARPAELSEPEFLAPYAHEMGINTNTIAQLQADHAMH